MAEKVNMPSQKKEKKKKRKKKLPSDFYDYNLLACTILLVSFGLIMLYSASAYEAVSYTHLDVYKRQSDRRFRLCNSL